jgi:two-component system NtrC family sensor kinase
MIGCFAGQLNQVWMNLLVNAAQAIEVDGEVRITTSANSKHVFIRISDTGCGIEPEHVRKIFDPFFTTKEVGEGVGLGLSVSYGIIERHSGSITVESDPGNGSAFTVAIPIDT